MRVTSFENRQLSLIINFMTNLEKIFFYIFANFVPLREKQFFRKDAKGAKEYFSVILDIWQNKRADVRFIGIQTSLQCQLQSISQIFGRNNCIH